VRADERLTVLDAKFPHQVAKLPKFAEEHIFEPVLFLAALFWVRVRDPADSCTFTKCARANIIAASI
jgi:hypothetical protein